MSETYKEISPEVVNTVNMSDTNLSAVKEGMLSVTVDGTAIASGTQKEISLSTFQPKRHKSASCKQNANTSAPNSTSFCA